MATPCTEASRGFTLNLRGHLTEVPGGAVMAILNVTPDSFYADSRAWGDIEDVRARVRALVDAGAEMIDVGGCSTRPGADDVDAREELRRVAIGLDACREAAPGVPLSVDTWRADVARAAVLDHGADIVNDISGGELDPEMYDTVARLKVPYILMHMRGTPATMQTLTDYDAEGGVVAAVTRWLGERIERLHDMGVADVVADPGFGFAKTVAQNYELLRSLSAMRSVLGVPLLVGISRKSMFTRPLGVTAAEALPATTAAHTLALLQGADIVRVHDVAAARQARAVVQMTQMLP